MPWSGWNCRPCSRGAGVRDDALVGRLLEKRRVRIAASTDLAETVYLLRALVSDFKAVADVSAETSRLDGMSRQSDVKKALKRERDADEAEERMLREILELEGQLGDEGRHAVALLTLGNRLSTLSRTARSEADTADRRQARRLLRSLAAGASGRVQDREYLALLEKHRLPGR